jgi:hypothetical protein
MEILPKKIGGGQGITTRWRRCPISGAKQGIQKIKIKKNKISVISTGCKITPRC